jgi:hypothetical protein
MACADHDVLGVGSNPPTWRFCDDLHAMTQEWDQPR